MKNKTVETLKSALHFEKFNIAKNENFSCGDERAKRTKGITLIALVITIIILLILAGVAISQLGENGLLGKTEITKTKTEYAYAKEIVDTELMAIQFDCIQNKRDYNIVEIAKSLKENKQITIEKYYNSSTASIKDGVNENIVDLKAIVVSADQYSQYKFLIGESCKIEGVSAEEIPSTTTLEDDIRKYFRDVEDFETGIASNDVTKGNIDIFKELTDSNKTVDDLSEYGMTVSRKGKNQYAGYNELNSLGMGSGTGVNRNTFTLTIDYNTLMEKSGNKQFKGLYAKFYHSVKTTDWADVSWIYSKIVVTYDDNTTSEVQTEEDRANHSSIEGERELTAIFDTSKKVTQIQIIIDMLDGDDGYAIGAIRYMEFLR